MNASIFWEHCSSGLNGICFSRVPTQLGQWSGNDLKLELNYVDIFILKITGYLSHEYLPYILNHSLETAAIRYVFFSAKYRVQQLCV